MIFFLTALIFFLIAPNKSILIKNSSASTGISASLISPRDNGGFKNNLTLAPAVSKERRISPHLETVSVPPFSARNVFVADAASFNSLYEKGSETQAPIASLSKLMTAIVVLDSGLDWSEKITIQSLDIREGSSPFSVGDKIDVKTLFLSMLAASDNVAAAALARAAALGEEAFVRIMNERAREFGLTQTKFLDPTGLDPGNTSTAKDVAKLAKIAFARPALRDAAVIPFFLYNKNGQSKKIWNTDWLIKSSLNEGLYHLIGGKTGFIEESKYNLVLIVAKEGVGEVIVAALGSETSKSRFEDAKNLILWTFDNWQRNFSSEREESGSFP